MKPILCNYYITYRCNAHCIFCDIWRSPQHSSKKDAEIKEVIRNLRDLRRLGVKFIDFTGGEPLLHKDLPVMLTEARRLGFFTSVTTNCLLYPTRARELQGLVNFLHFSLDSSEEKEHDALRGTRTFFRVMESIDLALELGEKPDLLFTVTNQNYQAIDELYQFALQKKLILIVNPVFSNGGYNSLGNAVLDYLDGYQQRPYVYINRALHRLIRGGGNDPGNPRCRAVSSTVVISPQNELLLPCFHRARFKIPVRNTLIALRKTAAVQKALRDQGRYPFCQGCTINCYFDPSFLFQWDTYFWESLISKAKYGYDKYVRLSRSKLHLKK
ncbi:MAG: radical SAM protein [candidate division KSB1 bacterium]|nr:radical SAM protein [candidate division KSB1 bacterium]